MIDIGDKVGIKDKYSPLDGKIGIVFAVWRTTPRFVVDVDGFNHTHHTSNLEPL